MCKAAISFLLNPADPTDLQQVPQYQHESLDPANSLALLSSCVEKHHSVIATPDSPMSATTSHEASDESCTEISISDDDMETSPIKQAKKTEKKNVKPMKPKTKRTRKSRPPPCTVEGCPNIVVSRGVCVRHGGGSRCTEPGCSNRAKLYKKCFQHGGYKTCEVEGCGKKAKRYGHCWSHGGGRICRVGDCDKVSTQGGLCWAHGGGNRCRMDGCNRRSYQKYDYYCADHCM